MEKLVVKENEDGNIYVNNYNLKEIINSIEQIKKYFEEFFKNQKILTKDDYEKNVYPILNLENVDNK